MYVDVGKPLMKYKLNLLILTKYELQYIFSQI